MKKSSDKQYFTGSLGQKIYVQEWGGDQTKPVVLLIHGFPGCADQAQLLMSSPLGHQIRLISFDRPGYGQSSAQEKFTAIKFSLQIKKFLDEQNINLVSILSVSGGAPYALALAYTLKNRVKKLISLGGIAPISAQNFRFMNKNQKKIWMAQKLLPRKIIEKKVRNVWSNGLEHIEEQLFTDMSSFSESDQMAFQDGQLFQFLIKTFKDSLRNGPEGLLTDIDVFSKNWGFSLNQITTPVSLWHGDQDHVVDVQFAKHMKKKLPSCQLKIKKNEGHYSLLINYRDLIIYDLLS